MKNKRVNSFAHNIKIVINGNVQVYGTLPGDPVPLSLQDDELGEIIKQKPEIAFNTTRTTKRGKKAPDGIEIRFGDARPTEETRTILKEHGFQFSEKQTIWYAIDNTKSRELAERWEQEEVDVDTTQYIKQNFWARVRSNDEFDLLRDKTEFFVKVDPPQNFYSKSQLLKSPLLLGKLLREGKLFFKKHFNKAVEDEEVDNEYDSIAVSEKLKTLADGMQSLIDAKINSATSKQRRTAKRVRVAASMREEGYRLHNTQTVLYALSWAHSTGTIQDFHYLQHIRTKSQVELLNLYSRFIKEQWTSDFMERMFESNKDTFQKLGIDSLHAWSLAEKQKEDLLNLPTNTKEQRNTQQERQIKELEDKAWRMNIPGFFPTPPMLIDRMLQLAELKESDAILEPSAGKGDILDAIKSFFGDHVADVDAVEANTTLQEILKVKGYNVIGNDFLEVEDSIYDKIIMNPPFENGQDVLHVTHALELLKHGGRVVAIVSEGPFFREFKKDKAFRELLKEMNAYISEPIKDAFKNAFNETGVNVRIVAINEDGSPVQIPSTDIQSATTSIPNTDDADNGEDDPALLQLEAEAELELLKMRVELERKRKQRPIDGVSEIDQDKLRRYRQKAWALQNRVEILDFN